jgi:hypothetical protein
MAHLFLQGRHPQLIKNQKSIMLELPDNYDTLKDEDEKAHIFNKVEIVIPLCNTWDRDIMPFRQCLIGIARHWKEMNPGTTCPINFTDKECQAHCRDGDGFNELADLWDVIHDNVGRDGWTLHENYDVTLEMFAELRESSKGSEW